MVSNHSGKLPTSVTRPRHRGIERLPLDHDLVARELAYPHGHCMHVHLVIALGPFEPDRVARTQLSRRVREWLPIPALGDGWVCHRQPAVDSRATADQDPTFACCLLNRGKDDPRINHTRARAHLGGGPDDG